MTSSFYIPMASEALRSAARGRIYSYITSLPKDRPFVVLVTEKKPTRSTQQNALLWSLYEDALDIAGEKLAGFDKRDLHELLLIEHFGAEKVSLFGRTKLKANKRSSTLSKTDFASFVDFVVRYFAEHGIVLRLPDDPV